MRLCFLINPTEDWRSAVQHGRSLCQSALQQNHKVSALFFYGRAAYIAADSAQQSLWRPLHIDDLFVCRTMIDEYAIETKDSRPPFQVVGMAPWVSAMEQADRIVEVV